jgi:hypothetical protein
MTHPYFKLALVVILGGCLLIAVGLGLQWRGAAAILVGGLVLGIGIHHLRASGTVRVAEAGRHPRGPFTAEDFPRPTHLPAEEGVFVRHLPDRIDADPEGASFVISYGDYVSNIPVTEDPWRLPRGQQLALALRATPGAGASDPKEVGHESVSGLMEDYFVRYECRLGVSQATVLALRATRFAWTDAAEDLAASLAPSARAVMAVRRTMAELARRDVEAHDRFIDLARRGSQAEPGSAEAAEMAAELRALGRGAAELGGPPDTGRDNG